MDALGAAEIEKRLVDRKRSTSGVSAAMAWRTSRPTLTYFAMSGRITIADGHSASALNIGIAERTPKVREM